MTFEVLSREAVRERAAALAEEAAEGGRDALRTIVGEKGMEAVEVALRQMESSARPGRRLATQPEPRYSRQDVGALPVDERFIIDAEAKP